MLRFVSVCFVFFSFCVNDAIAYNSTTEEVTTEEVREYEADKSVSISGSNRYTSPIDSADPTGPTIQLPGHEDHVYFFGDRVSGTYEASEGCQGHTVVMSSHDCWEHTWQYNYPSSGDFRTKRRNAPPGCFLQEGNLKIYWNSWHPRPADGMGSKLRSLCNGPNPWGSAPWGSGTGWNTETALNAAIAARNGGGGDADGEQNKQLSALDVLSATLTGRVDALNATVQDTKFGNCTSMSTVAGLAANGVCRVA